jgi:FhuF 2Fe-2S C-terminal domain
VSSTDGALRAAAAVGPYFTWEPWPAGGSGSRPVRDPAGGVSLPVPGVAGGSSRPVSEMAGGWRPLTDLTDGEVVAERVDVARRALVRTFGLAEDGVPPRVAASVTFLGLASRLLSPPLGALVLTGTLPTPGPDQLWWKPVAGGPWPFAYGSITGVPGDGASLVATIVNDLVAPVLRTFEERFVLSPQVLWGNVASALAGAAGVLADAQPHDRVTRAGDGGAITRAGEADPDAIGRASNDDRDANGRAGIAERAGGIVAQALSLPPLAGTGTLVRPDQRHPRRFLVRHNCCLYYRIPGGGTCGDCVLTPEPDRRRHWQAVLAARSR